VSVEVWIRKLERALRERPALGSVPIAVIGGRAVTLREALEMLRRGEHVEEIIRALAALGLSNEEEKMRLLAAEFFRRMPPHTRVLFIGGEARALSGEDLAREILKGTQLGERLVEEYRSYLLTVRALLGG